MTLSGACQEKYYGCFLYCSLNAERITHHHAVSFRRVYPKIYSHSHNFGCVNAWPELVRVGVEFAIIMFTESTWENDFLSVGQTLEYLCRDKTTLHETFEWRLRHMLTLVKTESKSHGRHSLLLMLSECQVNRQVSTVD